MTKLMDMLETNKEKKDIECNELIYIYAPFDNNMKNEYEMENVSPYVS